MNGEKMVNQLLESIAFFSITRLSTSATVEERSVANSRVKEAKKALIDYVTGLENDRADYKQLLKKVDHGCANFYCK